MLLFADYETYYDSQSYTLRKMTPAEYILDKRFEVSGMAIRKGIDGTDKWVTAANLPPFFAHLARLEKDTGEKVTMVTYNALFDMCITAWRYNYVPTLMVDVLGMVRACMGPMLKRASLGTVAEFLQLPAGLKGDCIRRVDGMRAADIQRAGLMDEYVAYAKQDVNLMVGIYKHLVPTFPRSEFAVMDLVLRCCVQPQFKFDKPLLEQHLQEVRDGKAALLAACGLQYDANGECPELMSTVKFKALLEGQGVVVDDKVSPTGKFIPALAKTDAFMQDLLEDPDPTIAALAAARLGHKSTLEETRAQRFIDIAGLSGTPGYRAGSAPMPLRYGAAHTHRLGGDWSLNVQNLPAGRNGASNNLRKSITCADDEEIIVADEAQIEARLSAWIAKETTLLREFAQNLDPYGQLGATIFGLPAPVSKKQFNTDHPTERFIGKTGILGLGYGAGADKFFSMVLSSARTQLGRDLSGTFFQADAQKAVTTYRNRYHAMPRCWNLLQYSGLAALTGQAVSMVMPPVVIKRGKIVGPNGQEMIYPDLKLDPVTSDWTYQNGPVRSKIYGAKMLENITQWLAKCIVMDAAIRLNRLFKFRMALQAHDELVFVVKKDTVPHAKQIIKLEMERRPQWAPDLPLEVEVNSGRTYGDAK